MLLLSNSIAQTVPPGQAATFDTIIFKCCETECFRPNSGAVRLTRKPAVYDVDFKANIGATEEGAAQVAIFLDGAPMLETTAISQTAAAGDLNQISSGTSVKTCACSPGSITVVNTGTTTINIGANPMLRVRPYAK